MSARDSIMDLASRISAGLAPEWCDEMRSHMDAHQAEVRAEAAAYFRSTRPAADGTEFTHGRRVTLDFVMQELGGKPSTLRTVDDGKARQTLDLALARGVKGDLVRRLLMDAYRTEVINRAVGRLRAIPVDCTALTGPVWYGDGWKSAITCLEEIADYQEPDDEAYPGEFQRLRALALAIRAALRKASLPEIQRVMDAHIVWEKERSADGGDFFQRGRAYEREHHGERITFVVRAVSVSPDGRCTVAHGWRSDPYSGWEPFDSDDVEGWTDVTEAGETA